MTKPEDETLGIPKLDITYKGGKIDVTKIMAQAAAGAYVSAMKVHKARTANRAAAGPEQDGHIEGMDEAMEALADTTNPELDPVRNAIAEIETFEAADALQQDLAALAETPPEGTEIVGPWTGQNKNHNEVMISSTNPEELEALADKYGKFAQIYDETITSKPGDETDRYKPVPCVVISVPETHSPVALEEHGRNRTTFAHHLENHDVSYDDLEDMGFNIT